MCGLTSQARVIQMNIGRLRICIINLFLIKSILIIGCPNGAVVTRLTRNEKIIGSIPILGMMSTFGRSLLF